MPGLLLAVKTYEQQENNPETQKKMAGLLAECLSKYSGAEDAGADGGV